MSAPGGRNPNLRREVQSESDAVVRLADRPWIEVDHLTLNDAVRLVAALPKLTAHVLKLAVKRNAQAQSGREHGRKSA